MNTRQTILVSVAIFFVCILGAWWYFGFSLDIMQFFASEPAQNNEAAPTISPTAQVESQIVVCSPLSQPIRSGVAATLTASGGSGGYEWFAPMGVPATGSGANFSVTYAAAGTKHVTVQARRGDGSSNIDSAECAIVVTP